jgi:hypothetical protein
MIDNKKIPTWLGVVIIVIFAVTSLVFVMVWENTWREKDVENNVALVSENKQQENEKENIPNEDDKKLIDTSDWKVCKNEKANYEFKYPGEWLVIDRYLTVLNKCYNSSDPRGSWFSIGENRYSVSNKSFGINTSTQKDLKGTIYEGSDSLDSYYSKNTAFLNLRTKIKSTEINGERVDWFKEKDDKISVWLFHNNTLYEIRTNINNQQLIESIMKTFSFPNN